MLTVVTELPVTDRERAVGAARVTWDRYLDDRDDGLPAAPARNSCGGIDTGRG